MYPKWMLYMGTKHFHRLIDENPAADHSKLNYTYDVITYVSFSAFASLTPPLNGFRCPLSGSSRFLNPEYPF